MNSIILSWIFLSINQFNLLQLIMNWNIHDQLPLSSDTSLSVSDVSLSPAKTIDQMKIKMQSEFG